MNQVLRCKDTTVVIPNNCSFVAWGNSNDDAIRMFTTHANSAHGVNPVPAAVLTAATAQIQPETKICPHCGELVMPNGRYVVHPGVPTPVPFITVTVEYCPNCGFNRVLGPT